MQFAIFLSNIYIKTYSNFAKGEEAFVFIQDYIISNEYRSPMSISMRGLVRARLRALFTLVSRLEHSLIQISGASEEAAQNLLSLSALEWDPSWPRRRFLTPGVFYGRDHLGR